MIAVMLGRQYRKVETMLHQAADEISAFADFPIKNPDGTREAVARQPAHGEDHLQHHAGRGLLPIPAQYSAVVRPMSDVD